MRGKDALIGNAFMLNGITPAHAGKSFFNKSFNVCF